MFLDVHLLIGLHNADANLEDLSEELSNYAVDTDEKSTKLAMEWAQKVHESRKNLNSLIAKFEELVFITLENADELLSKCALRRAG